MPIPDPGQQFAEAAHRLLSHLRARAPEEDADRRTWVLCASGLVAELYAAGLSLPAGIDNAEGIGGARALYRPIPVELGVPRAYFRHADPHVAGSEEVGDLGEDFEDLIAEITRGLSAWEDGTAAGRANGQAHWRRTMPHWGHHAVEAIRALHYWAFGIPG